MTVGWIEKERRRSGTGSVGSETKYVLEDYRQEKRREEEKIKKEKRREEKRKEEKRREGSKKKYSDERRRKWEVIVRSSVYSQRLEQ